MKTRIYIGDSRDKQDADFEKKIKSMYKNCEFYSEDLLDEKRKRHAELQRMISESSAGDTVIVENIKTLDMSLTGLVSLIADLSRKGVLFKSIEEKDIDTGSEVVASVFKTLADQQKHNFKKRQAEGIAEAKQNEIYKGRIPKPFNNKMFEQLYIDWKGGKIKQNYMMKKLGVSRQTLYRKIKDYENQKGIGKSKNEQNR